MVGFLDISDEGQKSEMPLRGQQVDVFGLSALQISRLVREYALVGQLMDGKPFTIPVLIEKAPDAIHALIAYGMGFDETEDKAKFDLAAKKASKLAVGEMVDVVQKIGDVTFGDKLNPFVQKVLAAANEMVAGYFKGEDDPAAPANGKAKGGRLRLPSKASLRSVIPEEMFGATHPGNSQDTPS